MTDYPFRNLVFEGGGVKGIAYVGALQALQTRNIMDNVERVGGTSAGAINAVLLACGYSLEETRQILQSMDFNKFLDDSWGIVRDIDRLREQYGWYKGDFFRQWMGKLIENKLGNPHATFNDFSKAGLRDLFLVGTNLSTGYSEVFSIEHTPRVRVADAARISMSIPLFFKAVSDLRGDVLVDGGVFNNYPVKLFDREKYIKSNRRPKHARRTDYYKKANQTKPKKSSTYVYNRETLGFRLDSKEEIALFRDGAEPQRRDIGDFFDYAFALINAVMNVQEDRHLHSDDWHRTVYINTQGVGTMDFDLPDHRKAALVEAGHAATERYFTWFDEADPADPPANRPDL
ncbi:patatin-like phospholipase family protein [uncultured Abyssibacter sp.]|uniref:patatin-like phospholipase family protein n=1 Tax=uncultured Abyssibacter sp. TaxID=2320202 RepID=UPI0032B25500